MKRWTSVCEVGWFGLLPHFDHDTLLPALSLWVVRISWCRGHLRSAVLAGLRGGAP